MFAIAFDMVVSDLKQYYGEPYNNAYFEIKTENMVFIITGQRLFV
jgi:virulence-associated protein VapD